MKRALVWIALILAVLVGLGFAASQTVMGQRLYYAMQIERTLDRYAQEDTTQTDVVATFDPSGRKAQLLSAFFGLDEGLPSLAADWAICEGAGGRDGMPVIFSHEVDVTTLDPGDFRVTKRSGELGETICLSLAPADDPGELRTVLLAGQFGDPADPPLSVEITGDILSLDGSVTFKDAKINVTPLEVGPSMVLAEIVPEEQWLIGREATAIPFGGGSGCPPGTQQAVRVVWEGGVTKPSGAHADDLEAGLYEIAIEESDGASTSTVPLALADIGDGDNNHLLCMDTAARVASVSFPEGHLTDPRDDLNPASTIALQSLESDTKPQDGGEPDQ